MSAAADSGDGIAPATDASKGERMRAAAARAGHRLEAWWAEFRSHSVYFQLKVLILLCYLTIVVGTIIIAPPRSIAQNQIGARILVLEGDIVMGRYFIIENETRDHWQSVTFEIDDGYTVTRDLVTAGEKVTLYVRDFRKKVLRKRRGRMIPKTVSASTDMELTFLKIQCSEGVAIQPLGAPADAEG